MDHKDIEERLRRGLSIFEQATIAYIDDLKEQLSQARAIAAQKGFFVSGTLGHLKNEDKGSGD